MGIFSSKMSQGEAVTVNGDRYWAMLIEFLFIKIEEEDIGNICFQQDGATFAELIIFTDEAHFDLGG